MSLRPRLAVPLVAALTALFMVAPPAQAAVLLTRGEVEVLDVNYRSGNLVVKVVDKTVPGTAVERDPADVVFNVPTAAKATVPSGSAWSFLGSPGSPVWILPQTQNSNLLWPSWNTLEVPTGVFANDQLTLELVSVTGGLFSVYTAVLGSPQIRLHSRAAGPKFQALGIPRFSQHWNWAFGQTGIYTVTFKVTGTLAGTSTVKSSGNVSLTFQVTDAPNSRGGSSK